jgi:hypothetical protein
MMLHNHPRLAVPYESGFLASYQERLDDYGDLSDGTNLRRLVSDLLREPNLRRWDHAFETERTIGRVRSPMLASVVDAIYSEYADAKGKARWGDKSDYLDRIHLIHRVFPNARFIHIIRDGRDVASSVLKLPWGPNDIVRAAEWWNEHVWLARRVGAILGPEQYHEVRFEELVREPERALRACCAFLGEAYASEMLAYPRGARAAIPDDRRFQHHGIDRSPSEDRVFAWKREMDPVDVAIFNRNAQRMLRELDYTIDDAAVSKPRLALRYLTLLSRRLRERAAV